MQNVPLKTNKPGSPKNDGLSKAGSSPFLLGAVFSAAAKPWLNVRGVNKQKVK